MENYLEADVAIVGAGAAGLMAACAAAGSRDAAGLKIVLLERNDRPGRKLSITGKGRCNITNSAEKEQFMRNIPGNGKFLFSVFSKMSNTDIVAFFEHIGVGVVLERGGRYFTKSGDAREVTDALAGTAGERGARLMCGVRVVSVKSARGIDGNDGNDKTFAERDGDLAFYAITDGAQAFSKDGVARSGAYRFILTFKNNQKLLARSVIIATGGIAYPATGSTGDGYGFAESFGHAIITPRPSLVPLETYEDWPRGLTGLTLKNITLRMYSPDGRKLFSGLGELLFTHFGVSGPLVLSASRAMLDTGYTGCVAKIDLKPGLSDEKLKARITRDFTVYAKKRLKNAMIDLMPARLIPIVIFNAGLDPENRADAIGKAGIAKISEAMKGLALTISAPRPPSEAIITAGGVKTDEINPATMESKLTPGLFFCGEVIDVDAYTGGYNLTIAFATGHTAGINAVKSCYDLQ